ncbi:hypothetical protein L1787_11230 [Acuticoccus sp. M5D2P5]|nr:hypothetical protein [Acuticoccus kalidii]MCF3933990.1 hypothetical protein [Acuticoccus kalidii]
MPLYRLAHGRAGDKGNRQNISVIAYRPEHWPTLLSEVTEARVLALFRHRSASACTRYVLPNLMALNFVIDDALEGGVNAALALDAHGKTSAFRLLSMEIDVPKSVAATALPAAPREPSANKRKQGGI